jgi:Fe-S-cluster containining protein
MGDSARYPGGFDCQRCGKCCLVHVNRIRVVEQDVCRWKIEGREDILAWVCPVDYGIQIDYRFPVHPATGEDVSRCPFLESLPGEGMYACRIYDARPDACRRFPHSRQEAEAIDCPGIRPVTI